VFTNSLNVDRACGTRTKREISGLSMTVDLDVLRKTTEELLCSRGVFDVDAFGWLNENDVDPEFVGYAM
jgi:hypothetical protein